jgi:hypothetical protein
MSPQKKSSQTNSVHCSLKSYFLGIGETIERPGGSITPMDIRTIGTGTLLPSFAVLSAFAFKLVQLAPLASSTNRKAFFRASKYPINHLTNVMITLKLGGDGAAKGRRSRGEGTAMRRRTPGENTATTRLRSGEPRRRWFFD